MLSSSKIKASFSHHSLNQSSNLNRYFYNLIVLLFLLFFFAFYIQYSQQTLINFDGAYNAQVAVSINLNHGYRTIYDGGILFDPNITTGPTLILPVSILIHLFGITNISLKLANILYSCGLLVLVYFLISKCTSRPFGVITTASLGCVFFPYTVTGLIGEIPSLFFLFLGFLLLWYYDFNGGLFQLFFSGLVIGLSLLTKSILIFFVPAILSIYLYRSIKTKNYRTSVLFLFTLWIPGLIFELYKVAVLGISGYTKTLADIYKVYLLNLGINADPLSVGTIFNATINQLSIPGVLFIFVILCNLFYLAKMLIIRHDKHWTRNDLLILLLVSGTLSFWIYWFLFNDILLVRRAIPFYYASILVAFVFLYQLFSSFLKRLIVLFVILSIMLYSFIPGLINNVKKDFTNYENGMEIVKTINKLSNKDVFYGFGWWQAPGISLYTGRAFYNIENDKDLKLAKGGNSYLVVDATATRNAPEQLKYILTAYNSILVVQQDGYLLYEISNK